MVGPPSGKNALLSNVPKGMAMAHRIAHMAEVRAILEIVRESVADTVLVLPDPAVVVVAAEPLAVALVVLRGAADAAHDILRVGVAALEEVGLVEEFGWEVGVAGVLVAGVLVLGVLGEEALETEGLGGFGDFAGSREDFAAGDALGDGDVFVGRRNGGRRVR